MNTQFKQANYQHGFSLGELGLVLLIVAIIGMFAFPKFIEYNERVVATEEAENITQYASKTRAAYFMDVDFAGLDTGVLRTTGIFPASMVRGNAIVNRYQGNVTAAPNRLTNNADSVLFTSTNYPIAGCREVVQRISLVARVVSVNDIVVRAGDKALDRVALGTACKEGDNTLSFVVAK